MAIESRWEPPEGLKRPGPRPVRLAAQGKVFVFLGVLFVFMGLGFGALTARRVQQDNAREALLQAKGADAMGTVIQVWRTSGKSSTPMVSYRFTVGGRELHGQSAMKSDAWRRTSPGDSLAVRYVPDAPEVNRPAQEAGDPLPAWMPWFSALMFLWPPILFRWMVTRETRLLAEGSPAAAVVTKVVRRKKLIVYYDFKLPTGEEIHGKSGIGRAEAPQAGEQVCVLYNPDNPRRNAVYPLETVRLAEE